MTRPLLDYFEPALKHPKPDARLNHLDMTSYYLMPEKLAGKPLFVALAALSGLPTDLAMELIEFGALWSGGKMCVPSKTVQPGEAVVLNKPEYGPRLYYQASESRVLYQDDDFLIYNKEAGIPCQGAPYDNKNQLLEAVRTLFNFEQLWLVHRLDAPTSGLVILAKNKRAAALLSLQFSEQRVEKTYLALAAGLHDGEDIFAVTAPISKDQKKYRASFNYPGLAAETHFTRLDTLEGDTFFKVRPKTGRTHQIRLHLAYVNQPILGDALYGGPSHPRLMLAALGLVFTHPSTGRQFDLSLF